MRVLLIGPDDVLPNGKLLVNFPDCPRVGEIIAWEKRNAPIQYFRVSKVCWIFTRELSTAHPPEIEVEPVDSP